MKILRCHKFIYGGRVYRAGDIIPDGAETGVLEATGNVEVIPDNIPKKAKREKITPVTIITPTPSIVENDPVENVGTDS